MDTKKQQPTRDPKKKPYHPPTLTSEKVFATDALGGCRMASLADGCGNRSQFYLSSL